MGLLRTFTDKHITGTQEQWRAVEAARARGDWDALRAAAAHLPGLAKGWLPMRPKAQRDVWSEMRSQRGGRDDLQS
jgi:hypothetical protein